MRSFEPIRDRILVRRTSEETITKGGIIIPDGAREKPQEGLILAVGPGYTDTRGIVHTVTLKPGDTVLFGAHVGAEIKGLGANLLVMNEGDVLGRVVTTD